MSELGHRQPQQNALMAGPDGVVYVVTPAGAVPSAAITVPARHETRRGHEAQYGQQRAPGVAGPCFSYSADGTPVQPGPGEVGPCFSYSAEPPRGSTGRDAASDELGGLPAMPVWACFSYSPDSPGGLPAMPVTPCFSYSRATDLPGGSTERDAAEDSLSSLPRMPGAPCFSYSTDVLPGSARPDAAQRGLGSPRGMPAGLCFSFDADLPPGIGNRGATRRAQSWVRRMPEVGPCFSYFPGRLPAMPVWPCFSYIADLPSGRPGIPGNAGPCFSY